MATLDSTYTGQYAPYSNSKHNPYAISGDTVKVETTDVDLGHLNYSKPAADNSAAPFFRFGSESASSSSRSFAFMPASGQQWPQASDHPISGSGNSSPYPTQGVNFNLPSISNQPISFHDDYDEGDDIGDLSGIAGDKAAGSSTDKQIRRRSSKACDQCRKLKCKCERTGDTSQCRSCLMLNAKCTFLGPSRKRGPPKGYIDAIEVRLHQTEALIGILLTLSEQRDPRAKSLIEDLSKDSLALEIISRVDNSPYGCKGRQTSESSSPTGKSRGATREHQSNSFAESQTHPSHEWQDQVISNMQEDGNQAYSAVPALRSPHEYKPVLKLQSTALDIINGEGEDLSPRRLRRKIGSQPELRSRFSSLSSPNSPHASQFPISAVSIDSFPIPSPNPDRKDGGEREEGLEEAVGQLSLNEDEQVRFHGKASGLHLLGVKERIDGRNEGGIWKFPKARVWPPLQGTNQFSKHEDDFPISMPDQNMQDHLMDLYWIHVHPALPIVHKQSFIECLQRSHTTADSPYSGSQASTSSHSSRSSNHVPTVLLLAMFSIAARYSSSSAPLPPQGAMWAAGDVYLESAKTILGNTYSTPRLGTCQALLLLGYREIGIGAMAQAWIYVGMAIRMAQDLGMHKSADKWQRVGGSMFSSSELQERRRIWYGCVVMDKYVSIYIGRPIAIFERDFDTELANEDEAEETDVIQQQGVLDHQNRHLPDGLDLTSRSISCFNASAKLSVILGKVMQVIYAIRPDASRTTELAHLEELLEKWYLELPERLRFDPLTTSQTRVPPPHVLTLHMQYWCTALLLHRPFIRHLSDNSCPSAKDTEVRATSRRSYDMCVQAANKITAIVTSYRDSYPIHRSSVFLCYYVFTASITHVSTLTLFPDDPQARIGLNSCMEALKLIQLPWPSGGRAWELLNGSKVNLPELNQPSFPRASRERHKRAAEQSLSNEDNLDRRSRVSSLDQLMLATNTQEGYLQTQQTNLQPEPYYPPWVNVPNNPDRLTASSLSTSVLPQQYSTGFVDPRGNSGARSSSQDITGNRYSQYWNDYSSLGQLDPTYGVPELSDPQQNVGSPMYITAPYSLYNSIQPH